MRVGLGWMQMDPELFWRLTPWEFWHRFLGWLDLRQQHRRQRAAEIFAQAMASNGGEDVTKEGIWKLVTGEDLPSAKEKDDALEELGRISRERVKQQKATKKD